MNQIQRAIEIVGSATKLAMILGVTPQAVAFWRDGKRRLPIEACPAIEHATRGAVTRRDLRPADWHEIWPELAELAQPVLTQAVPWDGITERRKLNAPIDRRASPESVAHAEWLRSQPSAKQQGV